MNALLSHNKLKVKRQYGEVEQLTKDEITRNLEK